MDFLDNNKDLPTHGMKRKTKMENQRGFSGGFVNLQIKLKKTLPPHNSKTPLWKPRKVHRVKENSPFLLSKHVLKLKYQQLCFSPLTLFGNKLSPKKIIPFLHSALSFSPSMNQNSPPRPTFFALLLPKLVLLSL